MFRILKMKMQLFQQYFLSMQDKNMWDKITKIWKREMQTRFILIRSLLVPMSSPQATYLRIFTNFVKTLYNFWKTLGFLSLVFRILISQETNNLLITIILFRKYRRFSLFLEMMIQVEDFRRILNWFASV